jgi:peptide/nickel transport system permease protein
VLIVTFVTFALLNLLPGDVSLELLGSDATPSAIARVRSELRLDDPLVVRYMRWLGQALQGYLGRSFIRSPTAIRPSRRSRGVRAPKPAAGRSMQRRAMSWAR